MVKDLKKRARAAAAKLRSPRVLFEYSVAWGATYRELFSGDNLQVSRIDSILDNAATGGRILLCGRAGSGKSVILRHLAKCASDQGAIVVFIDFSRWSPADLQTFAPNSVEPESCVNLLIAKFSDLDATLLDLDMVTPNTSKLIFLDGLNEVPASVGNVVLNAMDETVTRLIRSSVIIADRLARRQISEGRWQIARVEPLSDESIRKAFGESGRTSVTRLTGTRGQLLDWPFFLEKAIDEGQSGAGGAQTLGQFFSERVRLSNGEMARVAAASYDAYADSNSRTFSRAVFASRVGDDVFRKLLDAGVLEVGGDYAYFKHHLHHDFLAAMHVAANRPLWGYQSFNTLSFQASSFDSIALAFAQVPADGKPAFVREVYDWNPYAISFALAESEYRQPDDLDWEIEHVVLSMLAEKRWDAVIPTAERAVDALSLFPRGTSAPFLTADSLPKLLEFVRGLNSDRAWFNEWKTLFCLEPDAIIPNEIVARLADLDSIVGWTLANVLKRINLNGGQVEQIIDITGNQRSVVRWRAVHVLGAFPAPRAVAAAFRLLDSDSDLWVRYGAVRSVIEMAANADRAVRDEILDGTVDRQEGIVGDARLRDELVRALRIRPERSPEGWQASTLRVLSSYLEASSSIQEIDYWARAMRQVRLDHQLTNVVAHDAAQRTGAPRIPAPRSRDQL